MKLSELKEQYGDEYPAAVVIRGIRMVLFREGRFSRSYHSREHNMSTEVTRFMDGSASVTASELEREWSSWSNQTRMDFCQGCGWLHPQPDLPEMLRFVMNHGNGCHWSTVALSVAHFLPRQEAFDLLVRALHSMEIGDATNISQGIAMTRHSDADPVLRQHLTATWVHPSLWDNADFINEIAFDATTCITHLIELGASPSDFTEEVRQLSQHVCPRNRQSCHTFLSKHYVWLK